MPESQALNRVLSLPTLTLYGLGTIIGAGIYVLVGKVAATAGLFTPLAFILAGVVAAFTALSYAELSSRLPRAAGAALYAHEAWQRHWLSALVGWSIVLTGVVSAATLLNGFVGYLQVFVDSPPWLVITIATVALYAVAAWGVRESAVVIVLITMAEIAGLLYVLWIGASSATAPAAAWKSILAVPDASLIPGLIAGGFLAFYAFIGFEDMVNMAEEAKEPRKTMPHAIILALILATILYLAVAYVAVWRMPLGQLSASSAPLADLVAGAGTSPVTITIISLIAVINGVLVQLMMASRIMYGMANQKTAPAFLAKVHPVRKTPVLATTLTAAVILGFSLWLPVVTLAQITSTVVLVVFTVSNVALLILKRRQPENEGGVSYPIFVPVVGALLCVGLIAAQAIL